MTVGSHPSKTDTHRQVGKEKESERDGERERDRVEWRQGPRMIHRHLFPRGSVKVASWIQVAFGILVALVTVSVVLHLFSGFFFNPNNECFDKLGGDSIAAQVISLYPKVADLQVKVGKSMEEIQERVKGEPPDALGPALLQLNFERTRSSNLLVEIAATLDLVGSILTQVKQKGLELSSRRQGAGMASSLASDQHFDKGATEGKTVEEGKEEDEWPEKEEKVDTNPLYDFFEIEEIRKYIKVRENRLGKKNFMGINATYGTIGHACVSNKFELEQYMEYDVGEYCQDDWTLAQRLMVLGCDPLPRRRCLARGPKFFIKPLPTNESLWTFPDNRNVRWDNYICKNFQCLASKTRKQFFKCNPCFDLLGHEKLRWVVPNTTDAEFLIKDVLAIKPGEIRIGLDFSMGTGTFAARMRENDVTIISVVLNLGAPFSELIALRGLLPLYITVNQRLPFFDNTLDILHTTLFLDGWIDHQLLDFILFDFDRVLRPGGLLWVDRFFCTKDDLSSYQYYFTQLRYRQHLWMVMPKIDKDDNEVYFSAVLEKPPRPF